MEQWYASILLRMRHGRRKDTNHRECLRRSLNIELAVSSSVPRRHIIVSIGRKYASQVPPSIQGFSYSYIHHNKPYYIHTFAYFLRRYPPRHIVKDKFSISLTDLQWVSSEIIVSIHLAWIKNCTRPLLLHQRTKNKRDRLGRSEDATVGSTRSASIDFADAEQYTIHRVPDSWCSRIYNRRDPWLTARREPPGCHAASIVGGARLIYEGRKEVRRKNGYWRGGTRLRIATSTYK